MRRGTTPIHIFNLSEEVQVDGLNKAKLTYSQNGKTVLQKELIDLSIDADKNALRFKLTQDETNLFEPGKALIQLRAKDTDGSVFESQMVWETVKPSLDSEAM